MLTLWRWQLKAAKRGTATFPDAGDVWEARGTVEEAAGLLDAAASSFSRALELDPGRAVAALKARTSPSPPLPPDRNWGGPRLGCAPLIARQAHASPLRGRCSRVASASVCLCAFPRASVGLFAPPRSERATRAAARQRLRAGRGRASRIEALPACGAFTTGLPGPTQQPRVDLYAARRPRGGGRSISGGPSVPLRPAPRAAVTRVGLEQPAGCGFCTPCLRFSTGVACGGGQGGDGRGDAQHALQQPRHRAARARRGAAPPGTPPSPPPY